MEYRFRYVLTHGPVSESQKYIWEQLYVYTVVYQRHSDDFVHINRNFPLWYHMYNE